jgi:hypothetical protein
MAPAPGAPPVLTVVSRRLRGQDPVPAAATSFASLPHSEAYACAPQPVRRCADALLLESSTLALRPRLHSLLSLTGAAFALLCGCSGGAESDRPGSGGACISTLFDVAACNSCTATACCEPLTRCTSNPTCAAVLDCTAACPASGDQGSCANGCLANSPPQPELLDTFNCVYASCQSQCLTSQ